LPELRAGALLTFELLREVVELLVVELRDEEVLGAV